MLAYIPDWLTDRAMVSQLAALAGIHFCSQRTVAERAANRLLTAPPLTSEDKVKCEAAKKTAADAAAVHAAKPWYRRVFSRKTAEALVPFILMMGSQVFIVWILPRITSQLVMSCFWVTLSAYLITGPFSVMLYYIGAGPFTVRLERRGADKQNVGLKYESATPDATPFFYTKRNRQIVAAMITVALIAYTAHDNCNYALPCFTGIMIVAMWGSISFPTVTVRMASLIGYGVIGICAVVFPIVYGIVHFILKPNNNENKPDSNMAMADWILTLMSVYSDALIAVPIMFLVMAALRYDHFGHNAGIALGPTKAAPGEAVPVSASISYRSGAMYRTAMGTMIASYLGSDALVYHLFANGTITVSKRANYERERTDCIKLAALLLVNLLVPATLAFVAWTKGELKNWWSYKEEWYPSNAAKSTEQADVDDAEKALLEPEPEAQEETKMEKVPSA